LFSNLSLPFSALFFFKKKKSDEKGWKRMKRKGYQFSNLSQSPVGTGRYTSFPLENLKPDKKSLTWQKMETKKRFFFVKHFLSSQAFFVSNTIFVRKTLKLLSGPTGRNILPVQALEKKRTFLKEGPARRARQQVRLFLF